MRRRILVSIFAVLLVAGVADGRRVAVGGTGCRRRRRSRPDPGRQRRASVASTTTTLPPSTTTTTIGRRGSGQPVTFAFAGDIHFEGSLAQQARGRSRGRARADRAGARRPPTWRSRTSRPRSPRAARRRPRSSRSARRRRRSTALGGRRDRRREHGEQPRHGLRARRARGLARRRSRAAASRSSGSATTRPRRTRRSGRSIKGQRIAVIGATQVLDDNLITAWTATDAQGGLASAKDVAAPRRRRARRARRRATPSSCSCTGASRGRRARARPQQDLARALVDAGADIVVGSHAHRLLGAGRLDSRVRRLRPRQLRVLRAGRARRGARAC